MGFEQLAALKKELAAQAEREQRQAKPRPKKPRAPAQRQSQARPKQPQTPQPERDPVLVSIGRLQKHFPLAFPKKPDPKVPLKLGISNDLCARGKELGLSEEQIKEAVSTWCKGSRYWAAMVKDAPRLALDGTPDGTVTAGEASHAIYQLRRHRREQAAARRAAAPAGTGPETAAPEVTVPEANAPEVNANDAATGTAPDTASAGDEATSAS